MSGADATRRTWTAAAFVAAVALLVWLPWARCQFVFDDAPAIAENAAIRGGDWLDAAYGAQHSPVANRPLTCLLLTLQFALFGDRATPFRVVSVLLHALVTWLLFALLRRVFSLPALHRAGADPMRPTRIAVATAGLWAVHPLAADAVAYSTQQSTLLMAACLLGAMHALLRAAAAPGRRGSWHLAVACTALGMLAKEDMVVAPLVLVLFDRALLAGSWRGLRPRRGLHLRLFGCWGVLLASVLAGPHNPTVGYDTQPRASAIEWLQTQASVVAHYARLAVLPTDQRTCYDTPILRELGPAVLPGAVVLLLLGAALALSWRRPWRGLAGVSAFLLLAPTSTVMPIVTEVVAERRVYLPLLALLVPVVVLGDRWLPRRAAATGWWLAALVAAAWLARGRVAAYADPAVFWADAYAANTLDNRSFQAGMILGNYGMVLRNAGDQAGADTMFERAMQCSIVLPIDRVHRATSLAEKGEFEPALALLRAALAQDPGLAEGHGNLASVLLNRAVLQQSSGQPAAGDPAIVEALEHAAVAVRLAPRRAAFANTHAYLLARVGRSDQAVAEYRRAIALDPAQLLTWVNLARLLRDLGRGAEVQALWNELFASRPEDADLRLQLADLMLSLDDLPAAEWLLGDAVRLRPGDNELRRRRDELRRRLGR